MREYEVLVTKSRYFEIYVKIPLKFNLDKKSDLFRVGWGYKMHQMFRQENTRVKNWRHFLTNSSSHTFLHVNGSCGYSDEQVKQCTSDGPNTVTTYAWIPLQFSEWRRREDIAKLSDEKIKQYIEDQNAKSGKELQWSSYMSGPLRWGNNVKANFKVSIDPIKFIGAATQGPSSFFKKYLNCCIESLPWVSKYIEYGLNYAG